jgi:hypothetical protein
VLFTAPVGDTTTSIFTVPRIAIFLASSGYDGETLDFTLREIAPSSATTAVGNIAL